MSEQQNLPEIPPAEGVAVEQQVKPKRTRKKKEVDPNAPATPVFRDSPKFLLTARIKIVSPTNPKRPGSKAAEDWTKYVDGMTVLEALQGGISRADIIYNARHNFLVVEGYDAPPPLPRAKKVKAVEVPVDHAAPASAPA
jgi:hypothetical protein